MTIENLNVELKKSLKEIRTKSKTGIQKTTSYVYGKEVVILKKVDDDYLSESYELETYYFNIKLINFSTIKDIINYAIDNIIKIELESARLIDKNIDNVVCYQLRDWMWLDDIDGNVVRGDIKNPEATLVMYCKFLKKENL